MTILSKKFNRPEVVFKPKNWGYELWIVNKKEYCGKLLHFVKNRKCSVHYHKIKDETFYIKKGKVKVWFSDNLEVLFKMQKEGYNLYDYMEWEILDQGSTFYVPPKRAHQIIAIEDTELFEFSTEHFEEDSYRLIKGD